MQLRTTLTTLVLGTTAALPQFACSSGGGGGNSSARTSSFDSDSALAWFDFLYDAIKTEALSPPVAARTIAYTSIAAYEAVVGGMSQHQSLAGQLNGLQGLPDRPSGVYHWPAVLNAAVAEVLAGLFASASAPTLDALAALEQSLVDDYLASSDQEILDRSADYGEDLAAAILAWAEDDGYSLWNNCSYTPPIGAGLWEPTPPAFAPPLQPCWGRLRPFVLLFGAECAALPPLPFSKEVGSAFYAKALEVYTTVNDLTQEQLDIAQFWADSPGATGTPPGHWISIASQVLTQYSKKLDEAVEAYVRVGLAVGDAFITCWDSKYFHNLLRPITYIQDATGPIADPAWVTAPGIGTPPFPEYTSGHSVQSGAASLLLEDLWGAIPFADDTHAGVFPERAFDSFRQAADEAAISRLYGGIHYRAAIQRGVEQGYCIGRTILDHVQFRR